MALTDMNPIITPPEDKWFKKINYQRKICMNNSFKHISISKNYEGQSKYSYDKCTNNDYSQS